MPIVNGDELWTQIRRVATFKHPPIMIASSNDVAVDRIQARHAGASVLLTAYPVEDCTGNL